MMSRGNPGLGLKTGSTHYFAPVRLLAEGRGCLTIVMIINSIGSNL